MDKGIASTSGFTSQIEFPSESDGMTGYDTGSAVGVFINRNAKRLWFVAIVKNNTEKVCAAKLEALGYEVYVPIQQEIRRYSNGRKKKIDRILLRSLVLLHVSEAKRREVVALPFIHRFMTDPASSNGGIHRVAVIPEAQIDTLKFMVGNANAPVTIESRPLCVGDKVRVLRGGLRGLVGHVITKKNETVLVVDLDILGCAKVTIDASDLEGI